MLFVFNNRDAPECSGGSVVSRHGVSDIVYLCVFVTQITKKHEYSKEKQQHQRAEINFMLLKIFKHRSETPASKLMIVL